MTTATIRTATTSHTLASAINEALTETRFLAQERKFTEAIELLTPFADSGDRNVLFSLNFAYDKRRLPGDRAKAREFLKASAALGHEKAISLIARRNLARWIGSQGHKSDIRPLAIEAAKAYVPQCLLAELDLPTVPTAELMVAVTAALSMRFSAAIARLRPFSASPSCILAIDPNTRRPKLCAFSSVRRMTVASRRCVSWVAPIGKASCCHRIPARLSSSSSSGQT